MSTRRATSLTLPADMVEEAKAMGVNISRAAEAGIAMALKQARTEQWKREDAEAIAATNQYIEMHGIPLADLRKF